MKHLKSFDNYKKANKYKEEKLFNEKITLLKDIELNNNDLELFKNIFNKVLNQYNINESIKIEIRNWIIESGTINEGFFDKLKDRFPKAAEVSKKLSDKAENVLGKILQASKDAVSFVKKIGEGIKELFINVINSSKKYYQEQIKGGKLKDKIKELADTKKEGLKKDIEVIRKVVNFYRKDFLSKLISTKDKNMTDFLTKEQNPVVESLLLEKGNVISTLVHRIEEVPPFSWLYKVAQAGEAGTNKFINSVSTLTNKLGGPEFQLPVIALIVGVTFEQMVKGEAGGWLISLAGSSTPLGMAINGMKMIAAFIALLTVIDATIGGKILGGHEHDSHDSHNDPKDDSDKEEVKDSEI